MKIMCLSLIALMPVNYVMAQTVEDIVKERYKAELFFSEKEPVEIETTEVELNNKEPKEILVRFLHREYCGSRGCRAHIINKEENAWVEISSGLITHGDIEVLKDMNNGFYNIRLDQGRTWVFDGRKYK